MVHRQYSAPHSFENTGDQSWNNMPAEQVDVELAREPNFQNGALVYPVENINQEAVRFTPTWTAPRSTGFVPFGRSDGFQHQPNISALSEDPFIHQSSIGALKSVPESYDRTASSSNYGCHNFYDADGAFTDPNIDAHMQRLKRKGPMIPSAYEAGSSSRYYFSGSSSNFPVASEMCHEKPRNDSMQMPCNCFCTDDCYNCNGHEVRSEGSLRNIRSRTEVDPNYNDARVPVPSNASHSTFYTSSNAIEHCSMVNHQGQNSSALTRQWNNNMISHAHGRSLTPDPGVFRLELGRSFVGSNNGAPFEAVSSDVLSGRNSVAHHSGAPFEAVSSDVLSGRNSASRHGFHGPSSQSLRHSRTNYSQRSSRDFRHPSNGMHSGNMGLSEERLHSGPDGYQRHRRPVLGVGWHHGDRNRRSRVCHERYRSFHEPEGGHHHQLDYEGLTSMDHSTFYASRNIYDQHRDLRLDIESMSYEDLLALGERIGSVSMGLSEDAMKKCLKESLYCSYDQVQDDSRCVICLEEYGNTDKIGKLKACGHDYHVICIMKWLSMKNLCPICKAAALEEEVKQK